METKITRRSFFRLSLAAALANGGCNRTPPARIDDLDPEADFHGHKLLLPPTGVYTGAYIEWGDKEDDVTLEKIENFEKLVGKHQAIVASSSYWGEQTFPDANVRLIARHGSIPLIYWSPWDKPYLEGFPPDKYSLTSIVAGDHDAYIDMWGDKAREFGWPMIVSFANEANGSWFPWSGLHYGAGTPIPGANPKQFQGPETFKAAWRRIVDRVRARKATNVSFVLHLMDFSDPNDTWNMARFYFPGSEYVDWLGISVYGSQYPNDPYWATFLPLVEWPYVELCQLDPDKPIMFAEFGVAELPKLGDKGEWIRDAFRIMKDPHYKRLKAAIFWHERWQNSDPEDRGRYSNLRVNSSPAALEAYRKAVADPYFVGQPMLSSSRG